MVEDKNTKQNLGFIPIIIVSLVMGWVSSIMVHSITDSLSLFVFLTFTVFVAQKIGMSYK